jgi:general secretion pathway protein L
VLLLPWRAETFSVAFDGDRTLVRTGASAGFVCDRDNLADLLSRAASENIEEIRVWGAEAPLLAESMTGRVVHAGDETADDLISRCEQLPSVDLLEGNFTLDAGSSDTRRFWRMAAVAAGAWVVLSFGYALTDYRMLASRSESLGQEIETVFRETFPDGERMVNPRVQMERALSVRGADGAGGGDLLPVLHWLTPVVARTAGLDPVALDYRDGQLDLDLRATEIPVLDRFLQGLEAEGRYRVVLQSAVQNADGVRGIIRVSTE